MKKAKKNRKAQLKIMETIFILIIFFILLMIGLIFYSRVESSSIEKMKGVDSEREVLKFALQVIYFPELSCMDLSKEKSEACFDLLKLKALMAIKDDPGYKDRLRQDYFDMFGNSAITVFVLFPDPLDPTQGIGADNFTIYDNMVAAPMTKVSNIPVTINDPIAKKNYFGYLEVKTAVD